MLGRVRGPLVAGRHLFGVVQHKLQIGRPRLPKIAAITIHLRPLLTSHHLKIQILSPVPLLSDASTGPFHVCEQREPHMVRFNTVISRMTTSTERRPATTWMSTGVFSTSPCAIRQQNCQSTGQLLRNRRTGTLLCIIRARASAVSMQPAHMIRKTLAVLDSSKKNSEGSKGMEC